MREGITEAGEGEPLVLLHGIGTSRVIWDPALPHLADGGRRAVAIDVPGFGGSEPTGPGFELADVADEIATRIRRAGVEPPYDLVGQSMGGALGLLVASRHPGDVRGLVLGAPAGLAARSKPVAELVALAANGYVAGRRAIGARFAASENARRLLFFGAVADGGRIPAERAREMLHASADATRIREAMTAIVAADLRPELEELRTPLGLVWGAEDITVPISAAAEIQAIRPGTPLEVIPGVAHIPHAEAPERYAQAVARLLKALGSPVTGS